MSKTAQAAFDQLAAMTMDATHPSTQYQECRRYFFAGVLWCLAEVAIVGGWEDDPEGERAAWYLESIRSECEQFGRDVAAGKA